MPRYLVLRTPFSDESIHSSPPHSSTAALTFLASFHGHPLSHTHRCNPARLRHDDVAARALTGQHSLLQQKLGHL
jgi:hypothetical protein